MFQERVRQSYGDLSAGYRRIADYLLAHYRDAAFMTASQIAQAVRVDTTSVVRCAQRLGYSGFPELIADIQSQVKRDLQEVYQPAPDDNSPAGTYRRSLIEDLNNLNHLLQHIHPAEIEAVVTLLGSARKIVTVGDAAAASIAEMFAMRLTSLGYSAWALPGDVIGRMALALNLTAQDVVVGIGPTAASAGISAVLKLAREDGVHTVAIVGTPANRAAIYAEHTIYAPSRSAGLIYSVAAIDSVIQGLGQALVLAKIERTTDWALHADHFIRRYERAIREQPAVSVYGIITELNEPEETAGGSSTSADGKAFEQEPPGA